MKHAKTISLIIGSLLVVGCAKPPPPPVEQHPIIPIQLLNAPKTTIINVVMPESPSTKTLARISKNDRADRALEATLDYTVDLKEYATAVTQLATECRAELVDRDARLTKIKQFIILNQPSVQPVQ